MAKKILVVEDEALVRSLLNKRLQQEGFEVFLTQDGEQGLLAMRMKNPDLVLLDIVMPKKSGFEVLEEMRQDEFLRAIPVIIISNSGQPVELDRARELGVQDWFIKTEFDLDEVIQKVNNTLAKTSP